MALGLLVGAIVGWIIPLTMVIIYQMSDPGVGDEAMALGIFGACTVPVGMGLGVIIGAMIGANR